jgi:uncharacterized MnhB-related membrane protein
VDADIACGMDWTHYNVEDVKLKLPANETITALAALVQRECQHAAVAGLESDGRGNQIAKEDLGTPDVNITSTATKAHLTTIVWLLILVPSTRALHKYCA